MEEYGLQACVSIPGHYLINFRKAILEQAEDKERVIDRDGFRPNVGIMVCNYEDQVLCCLLYTSPSPRDMRRSRMPSSA